MLAGSGGSGVVVARLTDGSWSAPSAISVLSGGVGAAYGMDVYDCVCVLNTQEAVDAYTKSTMNLGADVTVSAGPVRGSADVSDLSANDRKPVWTYVKSRGLYGAVKVDSTVIKQRPGINADAYGSTMTAARILKGEAQWPSKTRLFEVLNAAEGKRADAKAIGAISNEPTPGDLKE